MGNITVTMSAPITTIIDFEKSLVVFLTLNGKEIAAVYGKTKEELEANIHLVGACLSGKYKVTVHQENKSFIEPIIKQHGK